MRPTLPPSPADVPPTTAALAEPSVDLVTPQVPPEEDQESWGWTRTQRVGLGLLLLAGLVLVGVQYWRRPFRLSDPITLQEGRVPELEERVDPNRAELAMLLRVPGLDEKTAQAIVDYRDAHKGEYASGVVYQVIEDLRHVPVGRRGISRKKIEELRDFLSFPGDATQPAVAPGGLIPPKSVTSTGSGEDPE